MLIYLSLIMEKKTLTFLNVLQELSPFVRHRLRIVNVFSFSDFMSLNEPKESFSRFRIKFNDNSPQSPHVTLLLGIILLIYAQGNGSKQSIFRNKLIL